MELALLFMNPLPTRLAWLKAVKLILGVLHTIPVCALTTSAGAAKEDSLASTWCLNFEFNDLIDASSGFFSILNLTFPQSNRMIFEIRTILLLKGLDCRLHLLFKFENYMPSEPFAQLSKLLDKSSIKCRQKCKNSHRNTLRVPCQRPHLFRLILFLCQLTLIGIDVLLNVLLLLGEQSLLIL